MKHLFLVMAGALLLSCNVTDKKNTDTTAANGTKDVQVNGVSSKDPASATTIQWIDSVTQDLGNITKGQVVEISWKFKNTGDKPLIIEDVLPTCGCTVAEKPEEPIAVGAEGIIKAKYNSDGGNGHVSKQMTLLANIKNHNNGNDTKLSFTAEVKE